MFGQPSWKDAWNYMEAKNKETGVNIGTSNYLSTFLTDPNNTTTPKQAMTLFDKTTADVLKSYANPINPKLGKPFGPEKKVFDPVTGVTTITYD